MRLELKPKGAESWRGSPVAGEPDQIRRSSGARRQERGAIWRSDCDVELGNTRPLAVDDAEGIVLTLLEVDGVSTLRRSVTVDGFSIDVCASPSRVCRGTDPDEGGVVDFVEGKGVGACLAGVDVSTVVEDEVGFREERRTVDALVGAVLEADAADGVGE